MPACPQAARHLSHRRCAIVVCPVHPAKVRANVNKLIQYLFSGTGSKHVRIRSPTPGTPPPLDTIVGEASSYQKQMPTLGESDEEWGGDDILELPIIGETSDDALPVVGELDGRPAGHMPLQFATAGETLQDGMLESSFCRLEVSPTCHGRPSASVSLEEEGTKSYVNALDLPVVGEGGKVSSFSGRERGVDGSQCPGTYVPDGIFQEAETSSASDFRLPVVGEDRGDFSKSPPASLSSRPSGYEDSTPSVSPPEIPASLLDGTYHWIAS